MVKMGEEYQELLEKEQRRRKIKMLRYLLGIIILAIFVFYTVFYTTLDDLWLLLMVGAVLYINYELYRLIKQIKAFISLDDELHYEDGEVIKYNARRKKTKKRIPIESIDEVYLEVEDKPNLLFVVYNEDGTVKADSFYKQRIKKREKFMDVLEKKSLLADEPIRFEELKEKIQHS